VSSIQTRQGGIPLIIENTPTGGISVAMTHLEAVDLGRAVVADGRLKKLRETLGLTLNAMAELLYTAWPTYNSWEVRKVHLRSETAARVGRFYATAIMELKVLKEHDLDISHLVPFHVVATLLGIPQEQLLYRYREGQFAAIDAGILGLWVSKPELNRLRNT
jgi:DNA-binding XRE family transcriptional regulator